MSETLSAVTNGIVHDSEVSISSKDMDYIMRMDRVAVYVIR